MCYKEKYNELSNSTVNSRATSVETSRDNRGQQNGRKADFKWLSTENILLSQMKRTTKKLISFYSGWHLVVFASSVKTFYVVMYCIKTIQGQVFFFPASEKKTEIGHFVWYTLLLTLLDRILHSELLFFFVALNQQDFENIHQRAWSLSW